MRARGLEEDELLGFRGVGLLLSLSFVPSLLLMMVMVMIAVVRMTAILYIPLLSLSPPPLRGCILILGCRFTGVGVHALLSFLGH